MRHAESPVNVTQTLSCRHVDPPLTEAGIRQAEQAAAWLADRAIRRIYASPMLRAMQTAAIAGRRLGLDLTVVENLREIDCGVLEGRSDVEAWEDFKAVVVRWVGGDVDAGFEGGETGRQLVDRFLGFMRGLPHDDDDVLIVAHGGIFAFGLMNLCVDLKPGGAWDLYLPNTGLVLVDRTLNGYACVQWGLAEHLDQPSIVDVPEELRG